MCCSSLRPTFSILHLQTSVAVSNLEQFCKTAGILGITSTRTCFLFCFCCCCLFEPTEPDNRAPRRSAQNHPSVLSSTSIQTSLTYHRHHNPLESELSQSNKMVLVSNHQLLVEFLRKWTSYTKSLRLSAGLQWKRWAGQSLQYCYRYILRIYTKNLKA